MALRSFFSALIAALLLRLLDPDAGAVLCHAVDLRGTDPQQCRRQLAWVPQREELIAVTGLGVTGSHAYRHPRGWAAGSPHRPGDSSDRADPRGSERQRGRGACRSATRAGL